MFGHQAAYAAQQSFIGDIELRADEIIGNEVNLAFDVSVLDLAATWAVGAAVDLLPDSVLDVPTLALDYITSRGITSLFTVPTYARMLLECRPDAPGTLARLRRLMLTGEVIPSQLASLMAPLIDAGKVYNQLGATEFTHGPSRRLSPSDLHNPNRLDLDRATSVEATVQVDGELVLSGPGLFTGHV